MIDLHTHTTFSDGTLTPTQLIQLAVKKGVKVIAITDHDTCDGVEEALFEAKKHDIICLPGIELEIDFTPGEFHLLGINLKEWKGEIHERLSLIHKKRNNRNIEMIKKMNNDGLDITLEEIESFSDGEIIGRPHFAQALIKRGLAKNIKTAFENFLLPTSPYFVAKEALSLSEGLSLIADAGGISVMAHPHTLYLSWTKLKEQILNFKRQGLEGIEAWHSGSKMGKAQRLETFAENINMIVTGGSDFHGTIRKDRVLGKGAGGRILPNEFAQPFL